MKILVVSFYLPPTDWIGAGVQMHQLANAYVELGHDVTLIAPVAVAPDDRKYLFIPCLTISKNKLINWARQLSAYEYDFDFVHFAGCDHMVRVPTTVVHVRTFMGSSVAELLRNKSAKEIPRLVYLTVIEAMAALRADVTVVISEDTNRYLPTPGHIIPCGTDLRVFVPSGTKSRNPSILFVGMLDSRKRGRELVRIFVDEVRKKIPTAELWIVRDSAEVKVDGVKVFGPISEAELVNLYQSAWLFCLPSTYEGFGVPYIEAMACGTAVIATPNAGALEVLDNGANGVITDLTNLGTSIISLLSNEQERIHYSERGLVRSKDYDILTVAQKYIDLAVECRELKVSQ